MFQTRSYEEVLAFMAAKDLAARQPEVSFIDCIKYLRPYFAD